MVVNLVMETPSAVIAGDLLLLVVVLFARFTAILQIF